MTLQLFPQILAVCRLDVHSPIPLWVNPSDFFSITKTDEELSVVCEEKLVPADSKCERDWRAFKVQGPLAFNLTGILASIAHPLAEAKISIFAVSTFDTDYVLVKSADVAKATVALLRAGFQVV